MENSINFYHDKNLIETASDERLFVKKNISTTSEPEYKWVEIENTLYKSEKTVPSQSLGVSGDYFASYKRIYNLIKYSEVFNSKLSNNLWVNNGCTFINKEINPEFPYSLSTKMKGLISEKEHYIQYNTTTNDNKTFTFSMYIKPAESKAVILSLYDDTLTNGVEYKIDFEDGYNEVFNIGNSSRAIYRNKFFEVFDENEKIYRIGLTVEFPLSYYISCKLNLCKVQLNEGVKTFNKVFKTNVDSHGLYINSAQLSPSNELDNYIETQGDIKTSLSFIKLYYKMGNLWNFGSNKIYYNTKIPENIGNEGDILTLTPILNIDPFIKLGDGSNIDESNKPEGFMYYNSSDGYYYIKTKHSKLEKVIGYNDDEPITQTNYSDCRLVYENQKPNTKAMLYAITLNQQTYQHYTRCSSFNKGASHRPGFNTSGCGSFYGNVIQAKRS